MKSTEGSIGYVEFGSATSAKLAIPQLQVQGKTIAANRQSFAETFNVLSPIRPSFYKFTGPPIGLQNSWPMIAITNVLVLKHPTQDEDVKGSLTFFSWVYRSEGGVIQAFDLLPLENKKALTSVEAQWKTITSSKGMPLWVSEGSVR